MTEADPDEAAVCSRKGCPLAAEWALRWNNPKLHTADRRKTWVACPEHREHLADFLRTRGFLRAVEPLDQPPGPQVSGQQVKE